METKTPPRYAIGRQSSMAPDRGDRADPEGSAAGRDGLGGLDDEVEEGVRLMYLANEGDVDGMKELLDSGTSVNFKDIDGRTALHVAACQGRPDVVELLLQEGAQVNAKDRWGSTPLADAIYYKNNDVIKLLESHGAQPPVAPMHVKNAREVPEYEIDPRELDFTNSVDITKGTFCSAWWRGTQVAVKKLERHSLMSLHCFRKYDIPM